ncbi:unnamed protein product [Cylicostephanus goldi]|uniref:Uncharacterized protein n=1 Tax=Cylicostephanus goldi TaxID=71465 RepID=A0A3P6S7S8_CYLGO|nr:unnamed protein product [Cylicostephanus goldi]
MQSEPTSCAALSTEKSVSFTEKQTEDDSFEGNQHRHKTRRSTATRLAAQLRSLFPIIKMQRLHAINALSTMGDV